MREENKVTGQHLKQLQQGMGEMKAPKDLFAGIGLKTGFVPDNILFFRRCHTESFSPGGVNNNYHHRFELVVVVEQEGVARIGNHSYRLRPGEAVLIFPNQFHHYMDVESGNLQWLFITFELGNGEVVEVLKDSPRKLSPVIVASLVKLVKTYLQAESGEGDNSLEISYELAGILRKMVALPSIAADRMDIHSTDDNRDRVLQGINAFVRDNLHRQITNEELARKLGYSVSYLRTVFRDKLGVTLGRYIRNSRLSLAAQLLLGNRHSVTEVARMSGFESLHAFSRAFKNTYGTSPKTYSRMGDRYVKGNKNL